MNFFRKTTRWALVSQLFCGLVFPAEPPCAGSLSNLATAAHDYPAAPPGTTEFLLRTAIVDGKPYHDVLKVREEDNGFGFITRRIEREVRAGAPQSQKITNGKREPLVPMNDTRQQHFLRIFPVLNKNLDSYRRRRVMWSNEFIKSREQDAWDYLDDSIYVEVQSQSSGDIVAGLRFIMAPYTNKGKFAEQFYGPAADFRSHPAAAQGEGLPKPVGTLPVENELGISIEPAIPGRVGSFEKFHSWWKSGKPAFGPDGKLIPKTSTVYRDGMKMEAGALYVDETLPPKEHAIAWGEVWLAWLNITNGEGLDPIEAYYAQAVHAYADKASRRLYIPLGMELTPRYQKNGAKKSFEIGDAVPPIVKADGSQWWPIIYYPENIEAFFRAWRAGAYPRYHGHVAERLEALRQQNRLPPSLLESERVMADFLSPEPARRELAEANLNTLMHHIARHADMSFSEKAAEDENIDIQDRAKRAVYALNEIRVEAVEHLKRVRGKADATEQSRIDAQLERLKLSGYTVYVAAPPRRSQTGFYVLEPFRAPGR